MLCTFFPAHLKVAKWLVELEMSSGNPINIYTNNKQAFKWSYERGHLEVSEWLNSLL